MAYAWCCCSYCHISLHTGCHFRTKQKQTERMADTTAAHSFLLSKGPRISIKYAITTCCRSRSRRSRRFSLLALAAVGLFMNLYITRHSCTTPGASTHHPSIPPQSRHPFPPALRAECTRFVASTQQLPLAEWVASGDLKIYIFDMVMLRVSKLCPQQWRWRSNPIRIRIRIRIRI